MTVSRFRQLTADTPPLSLLYRWAGNFASPANRGRRLAAVGRTIRYDVQVRLLKKPMTTKVGTRSRINVHPDETNSGHAVYRNPPNWPHMGVWQRWLEPGHLFVDVGANIGIYSIFAIDLGAEVVAIEPNGRNGDRLRANLALNGYSADVIQAAVADKPGTVRITDDLDSYNHLVPEGGVEVPAVTLDDVLGDRVADGVKIDVEGAERLVLEGATRALSDQRIRLLQIEWVDDRSQTTLGEGHRSVARMLRGYGYDLYRPARKDARLVLCDEEVASDPVDVFAVPSSIREAARKLQQRPGYADIPY